MKVIINEKEYFKEDGSWYSVNKKGNRYKINSEKLIETLETEEKLSKQKLKPQGLGDVISNVTKTLGIEECDGCEKRKKSLNSRFNWHRQSRELTEDESDFILDLNSRKRMSSEESQRLFDIYNEITKSVLKRCTCPGLHMRLIERLMVFTHKKNNEI